MIRLFQGRGPFENDLEVIKLLCKDIWTYLYGKQLDNLRTNHKVSINIIITSFSSNVFTITGNLCII